MENQSLIILDSKEKVTFREVAQEWLKKKQIAIKPSTYNKYNNLFINHIFEEFGDLLVSEYDNFVFETGMCSLVNKSNNALSRSTVKSILYLIRAVIKFGARYKINENINFEFAAIGNPQKECNTLSKIEEDKLITFLTTNPSKNNLGILLSITTGLRIGEICALKKKNINFDTHVLYVCETAQRLQTDNGTLLVSSLPKSKKSIRYIPFPQIVYTYLDLLNIKEMDANYYILTNEKIPFEPRTLQYSFKKALKKCEIEDTNFHALRHTFATNCVELGFDIKTLSELLGHSSVAFTLNKYVHSSINHKMQQMRLLDSRYTNFS